jgi:(E)-4-hydroxy-3-methyl-but-2-enyl pyrophosphate reductase
MSVNVIISKNSGYCMGVKNAFIRSYEIASKFSNTVLYGEMVHNKVALDTLYKKGIIIKNDLNDIISDPEIRNVIIRAHGIPPDEEKILIDSGKNIFDLTCPIVKKVQILSQKLSVFGYKIIIFGKENHPEVIGIRGYCKNGNYVINDPVNIDKIPFDKDDKTALISQTTMNSDDFESISLLIKKRFPLIEIHNTLCNSPVTAQMEAVKTAKEVELMIIVGDKMSANNITLYDKVRKYVRTVMVERKEDLDISGLVKYSKIGIAGGSSTPDWLLEEIKKMIEDI